MIEQHDDGLAASDEVDQSLEALFAEEGSDNRSVRSSEGDQPRRDLALLNKIPVRLTLEVDSVEVALGELLELEPGQVLALNKKTGEPLDVRVNGQLLATAEVVVVDGHYGLRLLDIADRFKVSE